MAAKQGVTNIDTRQELAELVRFLLFESQCEISSNFNPTMYFFTSRMGFVSNFDSRKLSFL